MKRSTRRQLQRRMPMLHMSEDLRSMLRVAEGPELEVIGQMLLHYDSQVKRGLIAHPDRAGVAAGMHDAMDRSVAATLATHPRAGEVKCRRGCSACCHMSVDISASEAELLARLVKEDGVQIDVERLRKQSGRGVEGMRELPREDRACVFLQDGACKVYEHRPGACRKLNVITDPEWCDVVKHPSHEVGRLAAVEAEIAWSVLMTHDNSGQMADMLLEALK